MIDPSVIARADDIRDQFAATQPFAHVAIADFLDRDVCENLLADFPNFDTRHAVNEMGDIGGKAVRMDVRDLSPAYRRLDQYLQSDQFLGFVSRVTGIAGLLYDPDYIGGGTHDNRDGQQLDAHVDFNYHPRTRWHRRLNLIVYLNHAWRDEWGDALELHSDPWNEGADPSIAIAPSFNTCVIFETTESSWHGFAPITLPEEKKTLSRKSFAIYLYTRERPPLETAPAHATIYVPESLPAEWQAGRRLSAADLLELRKRFTRMRTHLRFLYEREKSLGADIETRDRALAEARRVQRLDLQGYALQSDGMRGIWPDDWAGADVAIGFTPTRAATTLTIDLWSPPELGADQSLSIELDGVAFTQALRPGMRTPVRLQQRMPAGREVTLTIRSALTWTPSADGAGADRRALAFKLLSAVLTH